jgi:hypothetical protein
MSILILYFPPCLSPLFNGYQELCFIGNATGAWQWPLTSI